MISVENVCLQDCEELHEWIQEKKVLVKEDSYRTAHTVHSKWTKHQAFAAEIEKNQARLDSVSESGEKLLEEKPEMRDEIEPKVRNLKSEFQTLQDETKAKGERIIDANREHLIQQGNDSLDNKITEIEQEMTKPVSADEVDDTGLPRGVSQDSNLVGVVIELTKIEKRISEITTITQEIEQVKEQAGIFASQEPQKAEEYTERTKDLAGRYNNLVGPLELKKRELIQKKEVLQFQRDMDDENMWLEEKMNLVTSEEYGTSLQEVNLLIKKNKTLRDEIENHEPRILRVCEDGQMLIDRGHPDAESYEQKIADLKDKLAALMEMLDARRAKLLVSEKAQQFFFDANVAEAWMSEQELYMMVEDRGKDEFSAQNLMKKHEGLEAAVEEYSRNVRDLGEMARQLIEQGHPESDNIKVSFKKFTIYIKFTNLQEFTQY